MLTYAPKSAVQDTVRASLSSDGKGDDGAASGAHPSGQDKDLIIPPYYGVSSRVIFVPRCVCALDEFEFSWLFSWLFRLVSACGEGWVVL